MDEQLQAQLLAQMKDVRLPEAVSWWPLALGWWILATLILIGLTTVIYLLWRRYQHNRYRHLAILELNAYYQQWESESNGELYLRSANSLLKRVIRLFSPNSVAQFSDEWIDTLDDYGRTELSTEARYALAHQCYQAHVDVDIDSLHSELRYWLKNHKREVKHA
jgi:hypothetical protein